MDMPINCVYDLARALNAGYKYTYKHGDRELVIQLNSNMEPFVVIPGSSPVVTVEHNSFHIKDSDLIKVTKVFQIPEKYMKEIRQRNGMEEDDTSRDDYFQLRDPKLNAADIIGWHFGYDWYNTIDNWLFACGLEITPIKK